MSIKNFIAGIFLVIGLILIGACAPVPIEDSTTTGSVTTANQSSVTAFSPSAPECIAPSNPGGDMDVICRAGTSAMTEAGIIEEVFSVTNMAGGRGQKALKHVVGERNDDDNLLVGASMGTLVRFAQKQYKGINEKDVRWLGALGADFGLIAVAANSDYETLDSLVTSLQSDPASIQFGGGSEIGDPDHLKIVALTQQIDVDPASLNYSSFDGNNDAVAALLDGTIDVLTSDGLEMESFVEAGDVRVLATLSPDRLSAPYDVIPTAHELGYDVEWVIMRGYMAPGDMSDEAYNYWTEVLSQTASSPEWESLRDENGLSEFSLAGEDFEAMILDQIESLREMSKRIGVID